MRRRFLVALLGCAMVAAIITGCGKVVEVIEESETSVVEDTTEVISEEEIAEKVSQGIEMLFSDAEKALSLFEEAAAAGNDDAKFLAGYMLDWRGNDLNHKDYAKAKEYYEQVEDINPYAKMSLGYLYKNGQGVDKDVERGEQYIARAIDSIDETEAETSGYSIITTYIVAAYYDGDDKVKAMEWYRKAADLGNANAMNKLGYYYQTEEGDIAKAMELYQKAAALGNTDALIYMGYYYEHEGDDIDKAMEWYQKAADLGNTDAMNNLAYCYETVEGGMAKAMEWYQKAADLGNMHAMSNMAYLYEEDGDKTKAMEWYQKAADLGHVTAINRLAYLYVEDGNNAKAIELYQKGADLGDAAAMTELAYLLREEGDIAKAVELYQKAADLGNDLAMNDLGYLYFCGIGVEKDETKANEWWEKAAALGNEAAKQNLKP